MYKILRKLDIWKLLVISTQNSSDLDMSTKKIIKSFKESTDEELDKIIDNDFSVVDGKYRRMISFYDYNSAINALEKLDNKLVFTSFQEAKNRFVVFMFPGQGSQYINMGLELYQVEKTFREQVDICSEYLKAYLGVDIRQIIYPTRNYIKEATQQLKQTLIAQCSLFTIEYSLAKLWQQWGVHPQAMIGHSIGEYVAACLAGVFSVEDALKLVASRGQLMQKLPGGTMLAVQLSEKEVLPLLGDQLSLASINGPNLCVISGPKKRLEELENQLNDRGAVCLCLDTSHAPHSSEMDSILSLFTSYVETVTLKSPQIPYISNVSGTWITETQVTNPNYWARHMRQTVRFSEGLEEIFQQPNPILLEVGPGRTLSAMATQHPKRSSRHSILSSLRHPYEKESDVRFLLNTLGQMWLEGLQIESFKHETNRGK
ncbi:acyltransferase domain-containing protein [Aetokthonos hydrillicola Thurmond2011]|jgi:acyl transferase domain-containing protein|uniref:Acyltransferase domain-containing protein n=1 Tax=Aetokthonos hydrillicola Thurmond2011 TaxID=2712845 RepID=A0AAP5I642_9CYAN|nr:acyltransferase domain-containing protein [Aetokthonos hydrillicola]MBO3459441.1 acyltransferase domain-containing protein [Aetokthonos hydrillicola CCALA 1050]MBW4583804.1 acyltransferase domain-containing protein [Aetokthonos hydrillicola CCALA 1050]MDR9895501.1 acyltransferase domain-containing protein [Aetokthonos hydrillicola Thurmond2011]